MEDIERRYRFLLAFLLERGVLDQYSNGIWRLRGIYGVDDSGLKGAGRTPEEAIDNAIVAVNLDPASAEKFWSKSCGEVLDAIAAQQNPEEAQKKDADGSRFNGLYRQMFGYERGKK